MRHSIDPKQMTEQMQISITDCLNCSSICMETLNYCFKMGGKHLEPDLLRLLIDCSEICQTSANFMTRLSELSGRLGAACAEVADRCAASLERFDDDPQMRACYTACRRASDSCRRITGATL